MPPSPQNRYLTFRAGAETLATLIGDVQEISEELTITRLPFSPEHLRGIVNLRGSIVPVVCLSTLLGQADFRPTRPPVLLVLRIRSPENVQLVACLVDQVFALEELEQSLIQPLVERLASHSALAHSLSAAILLQVFKTERVHREHIVNV